MARRLADLVHDLAPQLSSRDRSDADRYPSENIADLIGAGVIRAPFPESAGGCGATLLDSVEAMELISAASPSTALLAAMPLGLAGVHSIGPDAAPAAQRTRWVEQIDRVAADYRAGRIYAACNSEKGAGGSLAATKTVAHWRNDHFELTGEKILASFGRHADVFFSTAKVDQADMPGCGVVEFFLVRPTSKGVTILDDWDGFGMRSTESHSVTYDSATADGIVGFPNFIETVQPLPYWFALFASIPLGCAAAIRRELSRPAPQSAALRLRLADAHMREESLRAYLQDVSREWRAGAGASYAARVMRMKTYVTQEATKLAAELFALSGGRHYRRDDPLARALTASFAGTALRPPLPLALDIMVQQFTGE